jgi:mono/diheme cytochrome c family protein
MRKVAFGASVAALSIFFLATQVAGQAAPPPPASAAPAASVLPPGPGHDTMVRVCSACHAPEIAAQQRLSAQGWKDLVDTMASRGAPGSEADFAEITAYLAKNFPDKPTN